MPPPLSPPTKDPFVQACVENDKELRGRVKILGRLLGDVIRSQAGEDTFESVEMLRKGFYIASKGAPAQSPRAAESSHLRSRAGRAAPGDSGIQLLFPTGQHCGGEFPAPAAARTGPGRRERLARFV